MMHRFIFLIIGMFSIGCNTFIIAGLLPQISETIGQPIPVTGQGIASFSLAYLLSALLFSITFTNKSPKRTMQLALGIFIFGNIITLLSKHIVPFLIGRSLAGIGAGIFTPLCITLAVHLVSRSAKGRVLSYVLSANSAGVVFGVPFGLYLSSQFNWQLSITYITTLSLIALVGFSLQKMEIELPASPSDDKLDFLTTPKTLSVIGITCFTAVASLGLYSYIAPLLADSPNSLAMTLFCWGLGGFIGSALVGTFIDRTGKPQVIMAVILAGLILAITLIPLIKNVPYLGLIPFFMWGAFGWATTTPQQHILFDLHEKQGPLLTAINSASLGLGTVLGTSLGGLIIAYGVKAFALPFFAVLLLLIIFTGQLLLIKKINKEVKT